MKNGIKIYENSDGSFTLEWDNDHPVWCFLNNMSQEQIQEYFNFCLEEYLQEIEKTNKSCEKK